VDRIGCLWFTHRLSGAWQERTGDHIWEKRCSELDLLGCDPGSGYAALRFNTRESKVAYRSLQLRDGVRATPSSSPVVCRIVGAPPLCAPARVIPGRTLLEGEGRVGSRASPQLQTTPSGCWWWLQEVPIPVRDLTVLRTTQPAYEPDQPLAPAPHSRRISNGLGVSRLSAETAQMPPIAAPQVPWGQPSAYPQRVWQA
jgi:hypothetical protein